MHKDLLASRCHPQYLIPCSSHVLQLWELSCFVVLNRRCPQQTTNLASVLHSAPDKKLSFIELYDKACRAGQSEHNVRPGWKAASICPCSPRRVLRSSQVKVSGTNKNQFPRYYRTVAEHHTSRPQSRHPRTIAVCNSSFDKS